MIRPQLTSNKLFNPQSPFLLNMISSCLSIAIGYSIRITMILPLSNLVRQSLLSTGRLIRPTLTRPDRTRRRKQHPLETPVDRPTPGDERKVPAECLLTETRRSSSLCKSSPFRGGEDNTDPDSVHLMEPRRSLTFPISLLFFPP